MVSTNSRYYVQTPGVWRWISMLQPQLYLNCCSHCHLHALSTISVISIRGVLDLKSTEVVAKLRTKDIFYMRYFDGFSPF